MQTIQLQSDGAATAVGTLNINVEKREISTTAGSVSWLLRQTIKVEFFVADAAKEESFRAASLAIGDEAIIIAAENYYLYDEYGGWMPRVGIHDVSISWDDRDGPRLTFGASLTPAARQIIDNIADKVRKEFILWIEADGLREKVEINVVMVS